MPPIYRPLAMLRFVRDHRWTHAHLSHYLDEELSQPERRRVEEHVGMCPPCRRVLATLVKTLDGLQTLGAAPAPSGGIAGSVIARLREP